MNIIELKNISQKFITIGNNIGFWNTLNQLRNLLNQYNTAKKSNQNNAYQFLQQIEQHRQQALSQLEIFQKEINSYSDLKLFKKLKLDIIFGENTTAFFKRIQTDLDSNTDVIIEEFNRISTKATQLQQLFNPLNQILSEIEEENIENEDFIKLFFENGADISSLKELSKASKEWNTIIHSFARLVRENDSETKITNVEKGSIVLTVCAISTIILAICKASDKVLDLIMKYYELRKKAVELKQLKLSTISEAISLIEKQAKLDVATEANQIALELLEDYQWTKKDDLYNETLKFVSQGVRRLVRFSNQGGKIESRLANPTEEESNVLNQLKEKTKEFVIKEEELKKLENAKEMIMLDDKHLKEDQNDQKEEED
ncbi:MAG: hypothetical protein JNL75_04675 [Chitinophagales bacterium]|nr:hypothetical protein [Chitinophagales bacterium]